MKKTVLMLAATLSLGTVAFAQTPGAPGGADPGMSAQPPASTPDTSGGMSPPAGGSTMTPGSDTNTAPASGMSQPGTSQPGMSQPDASQPGMAQPGMSQSGGMTSGNGMAAPTPVDSANLPTCSRTVTDKCVQKGAMGRGRMMHHTAMKRGMHKTMTKKTTTTTNPS